MLLSLAERVLVTYQSDMTWYNFGFGKGIQSRHHAWLQAQGRPVYAANFGQLFTHAVWKISASGVPFRPSQVQLFTSSYPRHLVDVVGLDHFLRPAQHQRG